MANAREKYAKSRLAFDLNALGLISQHGCVSDDGRF